MDEIEKVLGQGVFPEKKTVSMISMHKRENGQIGQYGLWTNEQL